MIKKVIDIGGKSLKRSWNPQIIEKYLLSEKELKKKAKQEHKKRTFEIK